jgi:hypothetical protein
VARGVQMSWSRGGRFYGGEAWSPSRITCQIIVMQLSFYGVASICLVALGFSTATFVPSTSELFSSSACSVVLPWWWAVWLSFVVSYTAMGWVFLEVVGRAKKVADFAFTLFFWHLVISWIAQVRWCVCLFASAHGRRMSVQGFPVHWEWWLVHVVGAFVLGVLGERLSLSREMADIDVGDKPPAASSSNNVSIQVVDDPPAGVVVARSPVPSTPVKPSDHRVLWSPPSARISSPNRRGIKAGTTLPPEVSVGTTLWTSPAAAAAETAKFVE